jgi:hypothetical protein
MITPLPVVELAEIKVHEVDTDSTRIQARPATNPDSHCRYILRGRTQMWQDVARPCERTVDRPVVGGCEKIEDVNLAIRLEGGSEQVAAIISFVSSPKMIAGANCHHAARRTHDHPYLTRQLSHGEIWTAHGGVNPCGLVVRRGGRELRTRWLC